MVCLRNCSICGINTLDGELCYKSQMNYYCDTGWACWLLIVKDGRVVDGAPIFKKFVGTKIDKLAKTYRVRYLGDPIPNLLKGRPFKITYYK